MIQPERTAAFFDRYAADFDAIYGNRNTVLNRFVNSAFRSSMRVRYEMTIAGCEPIAGRTVLDVGSGPGHYSVELARRGAARVLGIDFADGMLDIARSAAARAGVQDRTTFERVDFFTHTFAEKFDCVILMGFMDYVEHPVPAVRKALDLAKQRAFFSFPVSGGVLAWQRKLRYRSRCDLFLYSEEDVHRIMREAAASTFEITRIGRDMFVAATL
jgi:2-polyprenyl-3-methyl-5-hydroxy-6-metoxy-1,4-benzoquinol methylase